MGKFKNKLYRFMYGRYGTDTLNKVYLGIYVAVVLIYSVVSLFITDPKISAILTACYLLLTLLLIVLIFFRMFSRNVAKRRRENETFCGFFRLLRNRFRDRKTHVYRKCPKCRAVLRLPKAKGKHTVVCPRCKERFRVKG
ncbi:MAG: hypothetical protein IJX94_02155 [Clostridia bacterium]|nr:hypothetical protein [Clostridia bacterium]